MRYTLRRSCGLALVFLCTVVVSASAKRWSPHNFPNPVKNVRQCGRGGKPSWICDPDHVLSEYSQNVVEGSIHEIATAQDPYRSAHCPSSEPPGYQVGDRFLFHQGTRLRLPKANHHVNSGCRGTGGQYEA